MAITQITTASIVDDAITSAKIGANQIGNSELDLTAAYAFTGTVTGAGSLVKVSTATASNSGTLNFDSSVLTDTYLSYILYGENIIPATDVTEPLLYFSTNNGSSFVASIDSGRQYIGLSSSGSGHEYQANAGSAQIATDMGNDANKGFCFRVDLINLRDASDAKSFLFHTCGYHGSERYTWVGGIHVPETSAINYVRLGMNSGNITSGRIVLYGVEK